MVANAAIYAPTDEVIDLRKLEEIAVRAEVSVRPAPPGSRAQFAVVWDDCTVTINTMDPSIIPEHIQGFLGWIAAVREAIGPLDEDTEQQISELMQYVAHTKQVLGFVIEPGLDEEGKAKNLIRAITSYYDGLFFANDSIYDGDGELILGPEDAPDYTN